MTTRFDPFLPFPLPHVPGFEVPMRMIQTLLPAAMLRYLELRFGFFDMSREIYQGADYLRDGVCFFQPDISLKLFQEAKRAGILEMIPFVGIVNVRMVPVFSLQELINLKSAEAESFEIPDDEKIH